MLSLSSLISALLNSDVLCDIKFVKNDKLLHSNAPNYSQLKTTQQ